MSARRKANLDDFIGIAMAMQCGDVAAASTMRLRMASDGQADQGARFRSYPAAFTTDNEREFTSRAFIAWTQNHENRHILIEPGRPLKNGYIERFNSGFATNA